MLERFWHWNTCDAQTLSAQNLNDPQAIKFWSKVWLQWIKKKILLCIKAIVETWKKKYYLNLLNEFARCLTLPTSYKNMTKRGWIMTRLSSFGNISSTVYNFKNCFPWMILILNAKLSMPSFEDEQTGDLQSTFGLGKTQAKSKTMKKSVLLL